MTDDLFKSDESSDAAAVVDAAGFATSAPLNTAETSASATAAAAVADGGESGGGGHFTMNGLSNIIP